jgi:hypothetical protein
MSPLIETLEGRRLCYASIPAGDTLLETVQIRATAATYASDLTLVKGTTYFLRATGYTRTAANLFDGDAEFQKTTTTSTTTASSWGITTNVGATPYAPTYWGTQQGDSIYGQYITPAKTGALSFAFANDGTDKISTLAVSIYAAVPAIEVATVKHIDSPGAAVPASSLGTAGVYVPLNDADWDKNGVADDKEAGAVKGDRFLLPITLPAIATATATSHIEIVAPKGVRVWLKADRTGSTVGIGLRSKTAQTVYVEGIAEQPKDAPVDIRISLPIAGTTIEETVPVTVFALSGPSTAATGSKQVFSSDAPAGHWLPAINGTLDTSAISVEKNASYANVVWADTVGTGYADFEVNADYLWGWPVQVGT